jgi:hypothetical protein
MLAILGVSYLMLKKTYWSYITSQKAGSVCSCVGGAGRKERDCAVVHLHLGSSLASLAVCNMEYCNFTCSHERIQWRLVSSPSTLTLRFHFIHL